MTQYLILIYADEAAWASATRTRTRNCIRSMSSSVSGTRA